MELLLVGMGGTLGSLARFTLGRYISTRTKTSFPIGTFVINVTGALLLGILVAVQSSNSNPYLFLGDGFLGAYTTFSTFMYESLNLLQDGERLHAFGYLLGSLALGVAGFVAGLGIGGMLHVI